MTARNDSIGWELGGLLLAFAQRPRNWLVLARNLVPVVGILALGWSSRVALLVYWIDGMCLLALLIAAMFIRGMAKLRRERGIGIGKLVFQGTIAFALFFGLLSIPYWMVWMELDLGVAVWQVSESWLLTALMLAIVLANLVASCQRGGYFGITMEDLRQRGASELELLATRGVAMVVVAWWTRGLLLAPLFAVVLTALEVWPQVKQDWRRLDEAPVA
jgi:hypothetical protein